MPLLWYSLSRDSVAPPPSPEGLFPGMEGIRGCQLCAEGPMCRRLKLRLKGQTCFVDWSSSLQKVLGKLLTPPVSTSTVIQDREQPLPPSPTTAKLLLLRARGLTRTYKLNATGSRIPGFCLVLLQISTNLNWQYFVHFYF